MLQENVVHKSNKMTLSQGKFRSSCTFMMSDQSSLGALCSQGRKFFIWTAKTEQIGVLIWFFTRHTFLCRFWFDTTKFSWKRFSLRKSIPHSLLTGSWGYEKSFHIYLNFTYDTCERWNIFLRIFCLNRLTKERISILFLNDLLCSCRKCKTLNLFSLKDHLTRNRNRPSKKHLQEGKLLDQACTQWVGGMGGERVSCFPSLANYFKIMPFFTRNWVYTP